MSPEASPGVRAERLLCGCKVNLGLRITGVREDGYHLLDSLFWPIAEPHDVLDVEPTSTPGIEVCIESPAASGLDPHNNTLTKAYATFAAAVPPASGVSGVPGVRVRLTKHIPMGAGLGGGSANAAYLLKWLNTQVEQPLGAEELDAVALRVGADCPFFLRNRPCRVRGIGDIITPHDRPAPADELVLVCPDVGVSTVWAYKRHDELLREGAQGLTNGGQTDTFPNSISADAPLVNDLEPAVFGRYPQLAAIKTQLLELGAQAACMSGSGSSIVGLFARGRAEQARDALTAQGLRAYAMPLDSAGM